MNKIINFFKRKSLLRNIIVGILILVTVGAAVGGIVALTRNTDKIDEVLTYESIGWTKYSIGGLASNGAYMSTDKSIYTEKAFECQGLNVTPVFDSEVSYQIYFYDQNNEFVHTTGRLTGTFVQDSVPFFAKYARIVITPNDDNKVTIFEKAKYAKQLKVKVYREQGFKNYTDNLLDIGASGYNINTQTGEPSVTDTSGSVISSFLNIAPYKEGLVFRSSGTLASNGNLFFYNSAKTYLGYLSFADLTSVSFVSSQGVTYYCLAFESISYEDACFVRFAYNSNNPFEFYCR